MMNYQIYIKKAYTQDTTTLSMPSNITGYECINRLKQMVPHRLNIENIDHMEFVLMGQNLNVNAEEGPAFIPRNNELLMNIFGNVQLIGFYIRHRNNMEIANEYNFIMNNNIHNNYLNNQNYMINYNNNIVNNINNANNAAANNAVANDVAVATDDIDNDNVDIYIDENIVIDDVENSEEDDVNANANANANAIEEIDSIRSLTCIICLDNIRKIRFDPCGHLICCQICASRPGLITCPLCRVQINERQFTFIP